MTSIYYIEGHIVPEVVYQAWCRARSFEDKLRELDMTQEQIDYIKIHADDLDDVAIYMQRVADDEPLDAD
jgi:hypothetical protein